MVRLKLLGWPGTLRRAGTLSAKTCGGNHFVRTAPMSLFPGLPTQGAILTH